MLSFGQIIYFWEKIFFTIFVKFFFDSLVFGMTKLKMAHSRQNSPRIKKKFSHSRESLKPDGKTIFSLQNANIFQLFLLYKLVSRQGFAKNFFLIATLYRKIDLKITFDFMALQKGPEELLWPKIFFW
jgi:hypothetical protein